VRHGGHYVWTKETAEHLISTVRRANTRRSTVRNGSDQYAGPCPAVRRCVDRRDDGDNRRMGGRSVTCHARGHHRGTEDTAREIIHEDVEMLRRFGAASLTVVFELPLSDVTVVDGARAVLECRVAVAPAAVVYLVSIVREVEREMESIGRPATKSSTRRTDPHTSAAPLNNDDHELSAFIRNTDRRACGRRRRLDASTAHRLVYVGDIIARHVTNQSVGDRIAAAASELYSQLGLVAMTSRSAVSGNRRLAERRTANTWTGADTGSGDCGSLSR